MIQEKQLSVGAGPFVYLKIYTITDGPESFIILSE
ncbi:hypothetical protein Tsp_10391 [Trichinella spiralis]|nr:hypothetical protein Tsp_10391 [Trichinella spiralis]